MWTSNRCVGARVSTVLHMVHYNMVAYVCMCKEYIKNTALLVVF